MALFNNFFDRFKFKSNDATPLVQTSESTLSNNNENSTIIPYQKELTTITCTIAIPTIIYILLSTEKRRRIIGRKSPILKVLSGLVGVFGFVGSALRDILSRRGDYSDWKEAIDTLVNFLKVTGIDDEMEESLRGGLDNFVVIGRIEDQLGGGKYRRMGSSSERCVDLISNELLVDACRYMKFATSAYGGEMIDSVYMEAHGELDLRVDITTKQKVCEHCGIKDIIVFDLELDPLMRRDGKTPKYLPHFVSIDPVGKAVVLSIRGTYSISELVTDISGFGEPFLNGMAHAGMAKMAKSVWNKTASTIEKAFLTLPPEYELIITGHSLGAGTACLLTMLCYDEKEDKTKKSFLDNRTIRCFAFASPPVFAPIGKASPNFLSKTVNFINQDDCVPYLSVESIRKLLVCSKNIEVVQHQMLAISYLRVLFGRTPPTPELISAYREGMNKELKPIKNAPNMVIPASFSVWMRNDSHDGDHDGKIDAVACDSENLSKRGIHVCPNMISDHMCPKYEWSLKSLLS